MLPNLFIKPLLINKNWFSKILEGLEKNKKQLVKILFLLHISKNYEFIESFRDLLTLNVITFWAGIFITSPVLGFLPLRAALVLR